MNLGLSLHAAWDERLRDKERERYRREEYEQRAYGVSGLLDNTPNVDIAYQQDRAGQVLRAQWDKFEEEIGAVVYGNPTPDTNVKLGPNKQPWWKPFIDKLGVKVR